MADDIAREVKGIDSTLLRQTRKAKKRIKSKGKGNQMEGKQKETSKTDKPREAKCRACGADIFFISYTRKDGSQGFHPCNNKTVKIITQSGRVVVGMESHFATCPFADSFRRKDQNGKNS